MSGGRLFKYNADSLRFVFEEYKDFNKNQGYNKPVYNPQLDKIVQLKVPKPQSIEGFCLFADIDIKTFYNYLNAEDHTVNGIESLSTEEVEKRNNLFQMATRIREEIRDHQIGGAAAGNYNASIITRLNGLSETINVNNTGTKETININIDGKKVDLT